MFPDEILISCATDGYIGLWTVLGGNLASYLVINTPSNIKVVRSDRFVATFSDSTLRIFHKNGS